MHDLEQHFVPAIRRIMFCPEVAQEQEDLLRQRHRQQIEASLAVDRYLLQLEEARKLFPILIFLVQDGDPAGLDAGSQQLLYLERDMRHLLSRAEILVQPGRVLELAYPRMTGNQQFRKSRNLIYQSFPVTLDQGPRNIEDGLGGPVIIGQDDRQQVLLKVVRELQHILHIGALEPIDALIVIADDKNVGLLPIPGQQADQLILGTACILVFIYEYILLALLVA